jgi:hypothetical protein
MKRWMSEQVDGRQILGGWVGGKWTADRQEGGLMAG